MSIIKPFKALRPSEKLAATVASPPYDVMNVAEARTMAAGDENRFLHVTRSEIDLPEGTDVYSAEIYQRAKENLQKLESEGVLVREDSVSLYVYRLTMNGRSQTAIVAACSIDEYDNDLIKKHEKTRPDKENDRTRHIVTTRSQTGLIFLCYRGTDWINSMVAQITAEPPLYDFTASDGVRHEVWREVETGLLVAAFKEVPCLYVADGHHRAASASRARAEMKAANPNHTGNEDYNYVVAALFPSEQLEILAYNRIVKDLNGMSEEEFLAKLGENFTFTETGEPAPKTRGKFCLYINGRWYELKPSFDVSAITNPIERLDVSILEKYVLDPILGIKDVRTDKRIDFVGGIRGTAELEKLVNSGQAKIAFSMFATTIDDLLAVADANEIMPPKSTWFEPKLRDGLLIHTF